MTSSELHRPTSRVLDILELLAGADSRGYTLTEIAKAIGAPKSSIFPIIHTLDARRFIQFDKLTDSYHIGLAAFTVGSAFAAQHTLLDGIRQEMLRITQRCEEICQMGVPAGNQVLYVMKEDTPSPIQLVSSVGKRFPMYCTALGKSILMEYPPQRLQELYPNSDELVAKTPNTIVDRLELFAQLQRFKENGYAEEVAESTENICCVAVPLMAQGAPVAALSVSIPLFRRTDEKLEIVRESLFDAKQNIEILFSNRALSSELDSLRESHGIR